MVIQSTPSVLIVEDSPSLAATYRTYMLQLCEQVAVASTGQEALSAMKKSVPTVMLLDLKLPDMNGLEILRRIRRTNVPTRVVVMTAHGSVQVAVEAMREGAADFLLKPFDSERMLTTARNALEHQRLAGLVQRYEADRDWDTLDQFIGDSATMKAVYRTIESAAPSKASVFITGESGTGKELCAGSVHRISPRRDGPFVALNCAAVPKELIESEIFGHRRGAFTSASEDREGAAVRADGGTLFLDEICEMNLDMQAKLLRFIQTGLVQPVGDDRTIEVDIRFVCATNRDPWTEVEAGRFREDLYYRLHVVPIEMPPLRDRDGDVLEIARTMLVQYAGEEGKPFERIAPEAEACLLGYGWPGNVRELSNVIRGAVVLYDGKVLQQAMLPPPIAGDAAALQAPPVTGPLTPPAPAADPEVEPLWMTERRAIQAAIDACDGNVVRAAAQLEVSPSTIYRKLQAWKSAS